MPKVVTDTYMFQSGDTSLKFSFDRTDDGRTSKRVFLSLLKDAAKQLEDEFAQEDGGEN